MRIATSVKNCIPNSLKRWCNVTSRNFFFSMKSYLFDGALFNRKKKWHHIIFVCKGNVCRSVFAEYRLRKILRSRKAIIESCGIEVDQGRYPPIETIRNGKKFNCNMTNHISKGMGECDFVNADLILTMEYKQYQQLISLFPEKRDHIQMLRNYAPFHQRFFCIIDDPYGWGDDAFARSFAIINMALKNLARIYVD